MYYLKKNPFLLISTILCISFFIAIAVCYVYSPWQAFASYRFMAIWWAMCAGFIIYSFGSYVITCFRLARDLKRQEKAALQEMRRIWELLGRRGPPPPNHLI